MICVCGFNAVVMAFMVLVQNVPKHHHEQLTNASVFNDQRRWEMRQLIAFARFLTLRFVAMF